MQECCICYVADKGFLLPSLVSASRARQFVTPHQADILLLLTDASDLDLGLLDNITHKLSINVVPMGGDFFSGFAAEDVCKSHVSLTTLGRFFIDDFLPQSCRKILYLDGDTWTFRDVSRFIEWNVPDGKLAGIEDAIAFDRHVDQDSIEDNRKYFCGIGLPDHTSYMNAGVFMTTRKTWKAIASEAFQFFKDNTAACRFHDQSAINAVVGDRRLHLSMSWNFQTAYKLWGIEHLAEPHIGHFTGNGKPWAGKLAPWANCYAPLYKEAERFSALALEFNRKPWLRRCVMNARQRFKKYSLMCRAEARQRLLQAIQSELARCVQIT